MDVNRDDTIWLAELGRYICSSTYRYQLKSNRVGNVFSHERNDS